MWYLSCCIWHMHNLIIEKVIWLKRKTIRVTEEPGQVEHIKFRSILVEGCGAVFPPSPGSSPGHTFWFSLLDPVLQLRPCTTPEPWDHSSMCFPHLPPPHMNRQAPRGCGSLCLWESACQHAIKVPLRPAWRDPFPPPLVLPCCDLAGTGMQGRVEGLQQSGTAALS